MYLVLRGAAPTVLNQAPPEAGSRDVYILGTLSADCRYATFRTLPSLSFAWGTYQAQVVQGSTVLSVAAPQVKGGGTGVQQGQPA